MVLTNRGLKLRLPLDTCFAMMAKLYPKVDAFKIFRRTEALEYVPTLLRDIVAIVCFYNQVDPVLIIKLIVLANIIGWMITAFGLFIIPYLVSLATVYNAIGGFGIVLAINSGVAYYFKELDGVIIYIGAVIISAFITGIVLDFIYVWFMAKIKNVDPPITIAETNFLNACRLYAKDFNLSPNFSFADEELNVSNWSPVFLDYAQKYPEAVARYDGMRVYRDIWDKHEGR